MDHGKNGGHGHWPLVSWPLEVTIGHSEAGKSGITRKPLKSWIGLYPSVLNRTNPDKQIGQTWCENVTKILHYEFKSALLLGWFYSYRLSDWGLMDTVRFSFSRAFSWYPTCLLQSDQWSLPTVNWPMISDRDHRFSRGPFSLCPKFHFIITSGYWVILAQTGCVTFDSPCTVCIFANPTRVLNFPREWRRCDPRHSLVVRSHAAI